MSALEQWMKLDAEARSNGATDLADAADFNSMVRDLPTLDPRTDAQLRTAAFSDPSAVQRERALWELGYRDPDGAANLIAAALGSDPSPAVRWNLLWLGLKLAGSAAITLLKSARRDEHAEVRDWTSLFMTESLGMAEPSEYTRGTWRRNSTFDQTLPLQIAGFAVVRTPLGYRRVVLSPLWFASLQGRVMACTRDATFMTDLTIEKCIEGYHPDGSNHYEIYPFAGVSWPTSDGRIQHRYMATARNPFYRSGRVEEHPGDWMAVPVNGNRSATTISDTIEVIISDTGEAEERRVVRSVRGQFFGWAWASVSHFLHFGDVFPGTVQLANPLESSTKDLVNSYLCGTFRGKIGDYDGDGLLDVNLIPCHGSPDGRLDYHADGSFAPDPFA